MTGRVATVFAVVAAFFATVQPASVSAPAAPAAAAATPAADSDNERVISDTFYEALLLNTPFVESTYDESIDSYPFTDSDTLSVLGNAVLLKYGTYDAQTAGVSRDTLLDHTINTIRYAAARDINVDPNANPAWGKRIYFDTTGESYFVGAAKLLWDELDDTTRQNVDTIIRGSADYVAGLGSANDPLSPGWTTNGLNGGFKGDTKMEEMGARTMPLATALAWLPDDPQAASWREWLTRWNLNMSGFPAADLANPTLVDGTPIAQWNKAQNEFDGFLVENHGSWAPIYQQSIGAYPGRNIIHFLLAEQGAPGAERGQDGAADQAGQADQSGQSGQQEDSAKGLLASTPPGLTTVPNDDALWGTMARTGTDSGVPEDFMVPDRHHLYGRNVLPITYRAVVAQDPYAARAERMLADHLIPYVRFAPTGRLTKFSGQPSYEPEARAEIAMAYLLHHYRDRVGGGVAPVSQEEYFAHAHAAVDYGTEPGLTLQQSPRALAAAVTKPGFTKFAYLPQHDDWLFDVSGASPAMLPSVNTSLTGRTSHAYTRVRDGIDATATVVRTPSGAAGYATLPDGSVAYASGGVAAGEGALRLHNLDMPGVPGLDGDRTFSWAGGSATLAPPTGLADGGLDDVRFPATTARYVRMSATKSTNQFGFSLFEMEAYDSTAAGGDGEGPNLALGRTATASSFDSGNLPAGGPFTPAKATDGATNTRWAVAPPERTKPGWLSVDLGSPQRLDRVVLRWESAFATRYGIEVSDDGQNWRTVSEVPKVVRPEGDWLNVDGRAGFVIRHAAGAGANPVTVTPTDVVLSDGPAAASAGMVIEGHPGEAPAETARQAAAPAPKDLPSGMAASLAGGQLSVFNLGGQAVDGAEFTVPQTGSGIVAYQGEQRVSGPDETRYLATLGAADGQVEAARFRVTSPSGGTVPAGLTIQVSDSHTARLTAPEDATGPTQVMVRSLTSQQARTVTVPRGGSVTAEFTAGPLVPSKDLARDRTTFPTSPLPQGMSSPAFAVDGDHATAWRPGSAGRMVVDLGAPAALGSLDLSWSDDGAPEARIEVSTDGVHYTPAGTAEGTDGRTQRVPVSATARYVAVVTSGARSDGPALADLAVLPSGG